jgi:hypothetical protein
MTVDVRVTCRPAWLRLPPLMMIWKAMKAITA